MRRCAPCGGEALNWSQNSGGWSRTSQFAFEAARREHALLGARRFLVAADAGDQAVEAVLGRAPVFRPSVLRAAERAAGGSVGSTASIGGQGSTRRSRSHSLP